MSVSCEPEDIANASTCFKCIPDKLDALIWLFANIAEVPLDPQTIADSAKCFTCIPDKMGALIYLACQIVNEGGATKACILGGIGAPVMAVPCNFSAYVQQPGPNYGLWLGDMVTGWAEVIVQGP